MQCTRASCYINGFGFGFGTTLYVRMHVMYCTYVTHNTLKTSSSSPELHESCTTSFEAGCGHYELTSVHGKNLAPPVSRQDWALRIEVHQRSEFCRNFASVVLTCCVCVTQQRIIEARPTRWLQVQLPSSFFLIPSCNFTFAFARSSRQSEGCNMVRCNEWVRG